MNESEYALRQSIIDACKRMETEGINQGTSGNISVRHNKGILITPSGLPYDVMAPEDIVHLGFDGSRAGDLQPSSEWLFHLDIIRKRKDINAVVHAHPNHCTAVAINNQDIPAVHYMIAAAGGPTIRCAPYATFGTEELSRGALKALKGRMCCLLANHGLIACGATLGKAMWLASETETLARQYILSLQIGNPMILPDEEIAIVVEKFKSYGPRPKQPT